MLIASVVGWFVIGVYGQTVLLHASLDSQQDDCVRPPLLLSQLGFNDNNTLWESSRLSMNVDQFSGFGNSREMLSLWAW